MRDNVAIIRKFLLEDFHINILYWKAWRAREVSMEKFMGSMSGSYALLPTYIGLLQQTNPGSLCFTMLVDDSDEAIVMSLSEFVLVPLICHYPSSSSHIHCQ